MLPGERVCASTAEVSLLEDGEALAMLGELGRDRCVSVSPGELLLPATNQPRQVLKPVCAAQGVGGSRHQLQVAGNPLLPRASV